jgi:hypothetical protein
MSVTQGGRTDFNDTVSINNFASASASACLDIVSTTKGILPPRMTTTQQNNISTPAQGLTIYNTTANQLSTYNGTGWMAGTITLISSQILAGAVATVTFSAIPQIYNQLKVIMSGRTSDAATASNIRMQLNGDTGANYTSQYINASNAGVAANSFASNVSFVPAFFMSNTAAANYASSTEILFPSYKNTTFFKTFISSNSYSTAALPNSSQHSGSWANTSAITSISFFSQGGGNFMIGSEFELYGIL